MPVVIISATLRKHDIDHGLAALDAGAVTIVQKPKGAALLHLQKIAPELREALVAASHARVKRRVSVAPAAGLHEKVSRQEETPAEAIGICASTGGPPVLVEILSGLTRPFPLPILLVQHISEPFVEGFATWLSSKVEHPVQIARDGQRMEPGVWLAPAGQHLSLGSRWRVKLIARLPTDIHCPSGNPLFSSLARHLGSRAVGVQLTGMGDDGAQGLLELKQAGGLTLAQDHGSCLIYGMPKAAQDLGAAQHALCPGDIATALSRLVHV